MEEKNPINVPVQLRTKRPRMSKEMRHILEVLDTLNEDQLWHLTYPDLLRRIFHGGVLQPPNEEVSQDLRQ